MQNKVLIIEDETLMLNFLEKRLIKENFNVDIAQDGKEAIKLIAENKYSLIISDLMLPFVSGFELIAKIRSDEINSETPILVVSAMSSDDSVSEAMSIGANDFLKKPFAVKVLLNKVNELFCTKHLAA